MEAKDWVFKHSDAVHPGDRADCEHCQEMIAILGPMPPRADIEHEIRTHEKLERERNYQKKPIPARIRWEVWERDNFTCLRCGARRYLTVDHITAESKGGQLVIENLQTLCTSCNCSKGNRG